MKQELAEYRILYRHDGRVRAFGTIAEAAVTFRTLDPFLSRLRLAGVDRGELLLVEAGTLRVVARRAVRRGRNTGNGRASA
jgi:hypothetical protein